MLKLTAIALTLTAGLAAPAQALERHWTITGPHGTSTADVERYCVAGVCYGHVEFIGPKGRVTQSSSVCTRTAPHVWSCKGTVIGPRKHTGTIQVLVN